MSQIKRVVAAVAFSISATLMLMFTVSRFPGMEIPPAYWIFGSACSGVISFLVSMQLVRQAERIAALQREREEFLQLLSHDMRAPQASIIALLDQNAPSLKPELSQRIKDYANRTLHLADGMVQLSRAQMLQYKFEELNIVDIGQDAIDALAPLARSRRITFEENIAESEILISGEPWLLVRAFMNLLDNAVKYSAESSVVRLTISRKIQDIRGSVVCSVSDSGIGIPDGQMAALFRRFEVGRCGPAGGLGGAGLGLAFVKTVVMRHGGTIHCDSRLGIGTTFSIELPAIINPRRV